MKRAIMLSLALSIAVCLILLALYPEADDFRLGNTFWNGMSEAGSLLNPTVLNSFSDLPVSGHNLTLLLIGPERDFTVDEAEAIARFINSGGQVILADELGFGNTLLEKLNLPLRIDGGLVLDPLFKEKSAKLPRARYVSTRQEVILNYASIIRGCSEPIVQTTSYSYLDRNMNGEWDGGEEKGPFTVGCIVRLGRGELVVFSDSSIFINSMSKLGSNRRLLLDIVGDRRAILDTTHWSQTLLTTAKGFIVQALGVFSGLEARYALIISTLILMAKFMPVDRKRVKRGEIEEKIEEVLKLNPSWNRTVLEKLAEEIRSG